jgi:hypothetical protein
MRQRCGVHDGPTDEVTEVMLCQIIGLAPNPERPAFLQAPGNSRMGELALNLSQTTETFADEF